MRSFSLDLLFDMYATCARNTFVCDMWAKQLEILAQETISTLFLFLNCNLAEIRAENSCGTVVYLQVSSICLFYIFFPDYVCVLFEY